MHIVYSPRASALARRDITDITDNVLGLRPQHVTAQVNIFTFHFASAFGIIFSYCY